MRVRAIMRGFAGLLAGIALAPMVPSFAAAPGACMPSAIQACQALNFTGSCQVFGCQGIGPPVYTPGTTQATGPRYAASSRCVAVSTVASGTPCFNQQAGIVAGTCCHGLCLAQARLTCPQPPAQSGTRCAYIGGACTAVNVKCPQGSTSMACQQYLQALCPGMPQITQNMTPVCH